jgi:hypothetical protein
MIAIEPELSSTISPENIVPDKEGIKYCGRCMIAMKKISKDKFKCGICGDVYMAEKY